LNKSPELGFAELLIESEQLDSRATASQLVPTLVFSCQLEVRPNAKLQPYPIPVLADPKLILKHFRRMPELNPFQDANPVNNTVSVPLPFDFKRRFVPDWKPAT
jgi:hypothetical protein